MKMLQGRVAVALLAWLALGCLGVQAQGADPATVAQRFWVAVDTRQYAQAWDVLTEESKSGIVTQVATSAKVSEVEVREMFDKHDPTILNAFWDAFRGKAHADLYAGGSYAAGTPDGDSCRVKVSIPSTGRSVDLKMHRESGTWHFGLLETFNN